MSEINQENAMLTKKLEQSVQEVKALKDYVIAHAIRNKLTKENVLFVDDLAERMKEHFSVATYQNGGLLIKNKNGIMSPTNPGRDATIDEAIDVLLSGKYKEHLLSGSDGQSVAPDKKEQVQNSQPKKSGLISSLKDLYIEAKEQGDGLKMVKLKRKLAELDYTGIL
jgi:hypothetical protein